MEDFHPADCPDCGTDDEKDDAPSAEDLSIPSPVEGDGEREDYDRGEKRPIDHGVKIRGKIKRGEDTRDQDELLLEGRGENAAEAAVDFEAALQAAEEKDWADRLRALQPGEDGDGDE